MKTAVLAVILIIVSIVYWIWKRSYHKGKRLPPGPFRWPLVGNIVRFDKDDAPKYPYEFFQKLSSIYGRVFLLQSGVVKSVVINGYENMKKIFTNDEWLDRGDDPIFLLRLYKQRIGLFQGNLDLWRASRRFTVRMLRDYGFGKKDSMETFLRREIADVKVHLDEMVKNGGEFTTHHFFDVPALNIIWALLTGSRFDYDDPKVNKLVEGIIVVNHAFTFFGTYLNAYPFLHKIVPDSLLGLNHIKETVTIFQRHMEQLMEEYRQKGTYKTEPENLVEHFLQHIDKAKTGEIEDPDGIFTEQNLVCILYDLFWAGSDTTSTTLSYAILWLTIHQDVQTKVRNELKEFITSNGSLPSLNNKNSLPYTRAVLLEVHRRSHIVPLTSRKVYKDTPFDEYIIPGGTNVLLNYHSVLMDESFWQEPEKFKPERFLDSNNEIVKAKADHVIPFGLGKRNCAGEALAESSVFLFFTFLFSNYEFHPISPDHKYNLDPIFGIVMAPKPFTVKIKNAN